jgi:hypothetical protein
VIHDEFYQEYGQVLVILDGNKIIRTDFHVSEFGGMMFLIPMNEDRGVI